MTDVGVIVGRFQVHDLHPGHNNLVEQVCKIHKKVIVVLGLAPIPNSLNNPLDFEARKQMFYAAYPTVTVLPLKDVGNDSGWSHNLDDLIESVVSPTQTVMLYGGRDSFLAAYNGRYPTQELFQEGHLSGTQVRDQIKREVLPNKDFRAGVIWASANRHPTTYPTVDVAIFDGTTSKLVLARKQYESLWRFPGGFANPNSASYEDDAVREAKEETGLDIDNLQYIGSFFVDDWRYRNGPDKIKTVLFAGDADGEPTAADDIVSAKWWFTKDITIDMIVPNHQPLIQALFDYYGLELN